MSIVFIALGSNLGKRSFYIKEAIKRLQEEGLELLAKSSLIETQPYGVTDQPNFINAVISMKTSLEPQVLLQLLLQIEQELGRVRKRHWGERTIDLDLLFYDEVILQEKNLILPHPDLQNRDFVLGPLVEIAPNLRHPVLGITAKDLLLNLKNGAEKR
ncbi:MAG TPA: 2-amino-4-hydroxy-6-hydroxymethyldihydropteridine diphosphokinase [Candidatus Avacidaminococcus intestinavium]|uniref:2-amino-4-hydroxy-6-hydroxymethyldihydropteridine diphosphokinase n=1 Tax=Candidatus Avacidaminococcus intestinavium TaxID=2840684 RepID=A0A9D1MPU1_9FIRM|nr:2-amino-4-hydroxy-6-hydroxymethyldihydropteridine diphosphokinase [Candidatus Avacidaminococcus intestinavium]